MIAALDDWGRGRGWIGSDPYEGLNARRLEVLKRTPLGRRILIQLVKRSPLDLRPALRVEPRPNPPALGHVLSAYSRMPSLGASEREARIAELVALLRELRVPGQEPSWSYPFDVETRVFFYPRTTPNSIATTFVGLGLLDAHEATGDRSLLELAIGAGDFFLRRIRQTPAREGAYFGYIPGDGTPIHNANLLVCGYLARLAPLSGREDFADAARRGVRYALAHQRPDGSWPYGERPGLGWVDGHHTGYVLDSLVRCLAVCEQESLRAALDRGLRFYMQRLILADGTPKFFADRTLPIDSQCASQAIATLSLVASLDPGALEQAWSVFGFVAERMRRRDGAFIFQRHRLWRISTPHIRWTQAPMLDALTLLERRAAAHEPLR